MKSINWPAGPGLAPVALPVIVLLRTMTGWLPEKFEPASHWNPMFAPDTVFMRARAAEEAGVSVLDVIELTDATLRRFLDVPRIAVCGLNPHAGESGSLGSEDRDVVERHFRTLGQVSALGLPRNRPGDGHR